MGIGSLVFYGPLSWLSQIYQSRGVDATTAGYLLLVMNFVGMIGSTAAPLLVRRRRDVRPGVVVFAFVTLVGFVGLLVGPNSVAFFWMVGPGHRSGRAVRTGAADDRHPGRRRQRGRPALGHVAVGRLPHRGAGAAGHGRAALADRGVADAHPVPGGRQLLRPGDGVPRRQGAGHTRPDVRRGRSGAVAAASTRSGPAPLRLR